MAEWRFRVVDDEDTSAVIVMKLMLFGMILPIVAAAGAIYLIYKLVVFIIWCCRKSKENKESRIRENHIVINEIRDKLNEQLLVLNNMKDADVIDMQEYMGIKAYIVDTLHIYGRDVLIKKMKRKQRNHAKKVYNTILARERVLMQLLNNHELLRNFAITRQEYDNLKKPLVDELYGYTPPLLTDNNSSKRLLHQ